MLPLALMLAHHDVAVGRVGDDPLQTASTVGLSLPLPRAEAALRYGFSDFSRVLRDGQSMGDAATASVLVQTLTPTVGVRLPSRTALQLSLPTGQVLQDEQGSVGLGDLQLVASQGFGRRKSLFAGQASLALRVPTGHYNQKASFSVTDIEQQDGAYYLTTYDTRASLGSGSFALSAAASGRVKLGGLSWVAAASFQQPVGYTPDEIWWGRDLSLRTGPAVGLGRKDRWQLTLLASGSLHTRDRIETTDEDTGLPTTLRVGQRRELGIQGQAAVRVLPAVACGLSAQVPVLQDTEGVQLVQRVGVGTQCSVGWGLKR